MRILGTLIAPTSGSAVVAGIPLTRANEAEIRQRISIMPEAPGLYRRLTVTENLEFFARLYGLPRREARIRQALEAVSLGDRADDLCGSLSKGLRQRAALARTLLNDPAVMFLDEPTSGLDPVAAHTAVWRSPELLAEVFFIPLLAGWAIWVGLAISARTGDIRVAQQLGILSSLPPAVLVALISLQVISPTLTIAASLAGALLLIDCAAYLAVSKLFDRERLVTGTKPSSAATGTAQ